MGYGERRSSLLGHGISLQIDELPVMANGFAEPLVEGRVIALEPKPARGVPTCSAATLNPNVPSPNGGKSLTGDHPGLMVVEER